MVNGFHHKEQKGVQGWDAFFVYFLMLENDWSFCPAYIARKAVILPEDPVITFWLKR